MSDAPKSAGEAAYGAWRETARPRYCPWDRFTPAAKARWEAAARAAIAFVSGPQMVGGALMGPEEPGK